MRGAPNQLNALGDILQGKDLGSDGIKVERTSNFDNRLEVCVLVLVRPTEQKQDPDDRAPL